MRRRRPCSPRDPARPHPLLGVPADRGGRPGAGGAQAVGEPARPGRRGARPDARRPAHGATGGPPRRHRPPRPRAAVPEGRPRRVRGVGGGHEPPHAAGGPRARRAAGLRPHPQPRLARRGRGTRPRGRAAGAVGVHDPRDRVRPSPGLGRQAPAIPHPRGGEVDGAHGRPRDHVLALHARPRRRRLRPAVRARDGHPQRDRPDRPPGGRRPRRAAHALRRAVGPPHPAHRPARLREGLPARARRAARGHPQAGRRGALHHRRHRHTRPS